MQTAAGIVSVGEQQSKAKSEAKKKVGEQQIKADEFALEKRQQFEKDSQKVSKGIKKGSGLAGLAAGIGTVALGVAALPAALIVGGATLAGGMIARETGETGKAYGRIKNAKWYRSDAADVKEGVNKQLVTDSVLAGVMTGASVASAGKGGEAAAKEVAGEATEEVAEGVGKSVTEDIVNKAGSGTYEITEKMVENSADDKIMNQFIEGSMDSSLGADATLADVVAKHGDGTRFVKETTITTSGMPAGVKETMSMPGNTYAEKLANKKLAESPLQMNAVTATPKGSYQYQNLTGSTKLGSATTMNDLTWDNMVGNMKSVINPLISGDSKAGSALSTFKSGKSLYDYYQGENMNEQESII